MKNYLNTLKHFAIWLDVPIEEVTHKKLLSYIDFLLDQNLKPKTINCHLDSIRGFYEYLSAEEELAIPNPVKRGYALKLSKPLPSHLRDDEIDKLFSGATLEDIVAALEKDGSDWAKKQVATLAKMV